MNGDHPDVVRVRTVKTFVEVVATTRGATLTTGITIFIAAVPTTCLTAVARKTTTGGAFATAKSARRRHTRRRVVFQETGDMVSAFQAITKKRQSINKINNSFLTYYARLNSERWFFGSTGFLLS